MKTLMLLAVLCLVLCVVLPQTDAYSCYNYRATSCGLAYISGCGWYRICVAYYNTRCYSGKRDQIGNDQAEKKGTGKPILEKFPSKFSTYDVDGNKRITFDEFRRALADVYDINELLNIFSGIDKNGDKAITCDEFLKADLGFERKPVCQ